MGWGKLDNTFYHTQKNPETINPGIDFLRFNYRGKNVIYKSIDGVILLFINILKSFGWYFI